MALLDGLLDGKVALVTGAAVGLGNAFARALAAQGASLVVCDVRDEVNELADDLSSPVLALEADVANADDVQRVVDAALERFGRVDVLVSNAGVWAATGPTDSIEKTIEDYDYLGETLASRLV